MQQNPLYGENLGNWYSYFSQSTFPHVVPHHMGNELVFPWISHSLAKCSETHPMGKTWNMNTLTYHRVWLILRFPPYSILYEKWLGKPPINFSKHGEMQQNWSYRRDLGCRYLYYPQSMINSLPLNSHPLELYIIWEMRRFSHQFLIAWEYSTKPILWKRPAM